MTKFELNIDLPCVDIKLVKDERDEILIWVETTEKATECHSCGKHLTQLLIIILMVPFRHHLNGTIRMMINSR